MVIQERKKTKYIQVPKFIWMEKSEMEKKFHYISRGTRDWKPIIASIYRRPKVGESSSIFSPYLKIQAFDLAIYSGLEATFKLKNKLIDRVLRLTCESTYQTFHSAWIHIGCAPGGRIRLDIQWIGNP